MSQKTHDESGSFSLCGWYGAHHSTTLLRHSAKSFSLVTRVPPWDSNSEKASSMAGQTVADVIATRCNWQAAARVRLPRCAAIVSHVFSSFGTAAVSEAGT